MVRRPLRPLAGVIEARQQGRDPNEIEAGRRAERMHAQRATERRRAEWRLVLVGVLFSLAFITAGLRMGVVAQSEPAETTSVAPPAPISAARADITDRHGRVMATNLPSWAVFVQPREIFDPDRVVAGLIEIFPEISAKWLKARIEKGKFFWVTQSISPEQRQRVHDLGEPGMGFAPREVRLYPSGPASSHVIGAVRYGQLEVHAAEMKGYAGVESAFNTRLSDPARLAEPLTLSLDLSVQVAMREMLIAGLKTYKAKHAAAVLMDAKTGEVVSLVSLPDFDPNDRPTQSSDKRLFNWAAQGIIEPGSTFKTFTAAMVLEEGIAQPDTLVNTTSPLRWGRFRIRDSHRMPEIMTLTDVIAESSNTGTARLAVTAGAKMQKAFLERLGLFVTTTLELPEARSARPLSQSRWSELTTMTVSYGHGVAVSSVHIAAAYAAMVNGGLQVSPTILKRNEPAAPGRRVISEQTSRQIKAMLRATVTRGTAKTADVPGYLVAGKTGSAEKPKPGGGYDRERVTSFFAGTFPVSDPAYVIVVMLDEASVYAHGRTWRTAGWTAAPLTGEIIRRIAPILGMRPVPHDTNPTGPESRLVRN